MNIISSPWFVLTSSSFNVGCESHEKDFFWSITKERKKLLAAGLDNGFNTSLSNYLANQVKSNDIERCFNFILVLSLQHSGAAQGKVTWRCQIASWQRKLRVLWAGKDASTSRRNHKSTWQSVNHPTHDQLLETPRFHTTWRSTMEPRKQPHKQNP